MTASARIYVEERQLFYECMADPTALQRESLMLEEVSVTSWASLYIISENTFIHLLT